MEIIQQRERKTNVRYSLSFVWRDDPNAGFGFPCDEKGNLLPMNKYGLENYQKCISGEYDVIAKGIEKREWSYVEPAIGICSCGEKVYLTSFTNTCNKCEADYDLNGSRLAPRSQWGEETGEHWSECY